MLWARDALTAPTDSPSARITAHHSAVVVCGSRTAPGATGVPQPLGSLGSGGGQSAIAEYAAVTVSRRRLV